MGIPIGAAIRVHPSPSALATQLEPGRASLHVFHRQQQHTLVTIFSCHGPGFILITDLPNP